MKRTNLLAILLAVFAIAAPARAADWGDEFDGTAGSPPDAAKWNIETGAHGFGGNELQAYTNKPENIQQDGAGSLKITALKTAAGGYTSARVNTQGKFAYRTGTLEWRAKLSHVAQGLGPALWTVGGYTNWPRSCEIDILETFLSPVRLTNTVICESLTSPGTPDGGSSNWPISDGTAWHVYRLDRTNDRLLFFVDGVQARNIGKDTFAPWKLDQYDHFLVANLAVGGDRPWGPPNASTPFPATMQIDYVRWWATIQPAPGTPPPTTPPTTEPPVEPPPEDDHPDTIALIQPASATRLDNGWTKDGADIYAFSANKKACWVLNTIPATGTLMASAKNQNNGTLGLPADYSFLIDWTLDAMPLGVMAIVGSTTASDTGRLPITLSAGQHEICGTWTNDAWNSGAYDANIRIVGIAVLATATNEPPPAESASARAKAKLTSAVWQALTEDEAAAVVNP